MTDVSNLQALAAKINKKTSPNVYAYAQAQAAATVSQEKEIALLRGSSPTETRPGPIPPDPEPSDFDYSPASPDVGETVTFSVIDPFPGVVYTWDRTADGVADYTGNSFSYAYTSAGSKQVTLYSDGTIAQTKTITVASGSSPLQTDRVSVATGGCDFNSNSGNNNYSYCYQYYNSSTTENYGGGVHGRTIAWSSGHLYTGLKAWVLYSFRPVAGRLPGRILNFHCHPNFGGYEPDNSSGVSPIALDWFGDQVFGLGNSGLVLWGQAEGARTGNYNNAKWTIMSVAEMDAAIANGTRIDLVLEVDIGVTPTPAGVRVYAQGENTPRVDQRIRTQWPSQTGYSLWQGIYNSNGISTTHTIDQAPCRIGRTVAEALADGVTYPITQTGVDGSTLKGSSGATPVYTVTSTTPFDAASFNLPSSLVP